METYKQKSILWILVKLKLYEFLFGNIGKKKKRSGKEKAGRAIGGAALIVLYIFSFIMIAVSLGFFFYLIGTTLAVGNYKWMYYAYMAIFMFLLCFIGTVFLAETQMFESKDNERLVSMPIPSWTILISRMLSLLISNILLSFVISIPAAIVSIIVYGFDILRLVFFLVGMIVIPLFALSFSMLAGWLVSVLTKRIKSTKFIKLGIAVIAMILYFYFVLGNDGWVNSLIANGRRYAEGIKTYIPPLYSIGQALSEKSILHFFLMIVWCVVPFVIVSYFVSKNFLKMITSGEGKSNLKYKSKEFKANSPIVSLTKIELERFFSSITYMMNGGMGLLLMIVMSIFSFTSKDNVGSLMIGLAFRETNVDSIIAAFLCMGILGVMGLVCISCSTISLEAKTLWIPKSLPAKGSELLLSKALPQIIVSIPFILITSVLLQLKLDISLAERLLISIIPLTANIFNSLMGVRINVRFPKFDWSNEAQAIKQGLSTLLVMILGVLPIIPFILGLIFLVMQSRITVITLLCLIEVVYIILTIWMLLWVKKKGRKIIEGLEN